MVMVCCLLAYSFDGLFSFDRGTLPERSNAAEKGGHAKHGYYISGSKDAPFFKPISNPDIETCPIFRVLPKSPLDLMQ